MRAVGGSSGYLVAVTAAVLLIAGPAARLLARRRQRAGASRARAWRTTLAEVGMVVGTLPPVWLVLSPEDGPSRIVSPLRGLHESLSGGPLSAGVQVVGNLLVFAAFGLLGPVRWRIGVREVVAVAAAASVVLETSQYVFDLGRFSDLGDVVLNAGGAGLVALCARPWWRRTGTDVEAAPRSGGRAARRSGGGAARRSGGGAARRSGGGAVGRQLGGDPTSVPPHRYGEHST